MSIVKMLFGSHLYGTATPRSDTDYKWEILRGVCAAPFTIRDGLPPEKAFNLFMEEYNKLDITGGIKHYEQYF